MSGFLGALGIGATAVGAIADTIAVGQGIKGLKNTLSPQDAAKKGVSPLAHLNRHIVGRDRELREVYDALEKTGRVAVLKGMGGVGKTTLARLYIAAHGHRYKEIAWLNAETGETIIDGILAKAPRIKGFEAPRGTPRAQAGAVLEALPADWLIVYDNATDPAGILEFLPPVGRAHVLVTSRHQTWRGFAEVEPPLLSVENLHSDGVRLLIQEAMAQEDWDLAAQHARDPETQLNLLVEMVQHAGKAEEAISLAETLGGLPLALVIAGSLMREQGGSFAVWEDRLSAILGAEEDADYFQTLTAAVKLSYDRLSADARWVLDLFAWWDAEGLEGRLLTDVPACELLGNENFVDEVISDIPDDLMDLCKAPDRARAALAELRRVSLIAGAKAAGHSLHRMAAAAVRQLQGEDNAARSRAAAAVLAASYPGGLKSPAFTENWPDCRRLTPHVLALHRAWPILSDLPSLEAETVEEMRENADLRQEELRSSAAAQYLFNQASIYLREMAEPDPALRLAEASLRLKRARLPEADQDIAIGWSMLGEAYRAANRPAAALAAQRETLRLSDRYDHPPETRASVRNNLAVALHATGTREALEESLSVLQEALAIEEEAFGPESAEVAGTLSNIALSHDALGQADQAIGAAERAHSIWEKTLPPGDARLGFSLNNLGAMLLEAGRAAEAKGRLQAALDLSVAAYGRDDHPYVIGTASWLTSALLVLGREAEARGIADRFGLNWEQLQRKARQFPAPSA